PDLVFKRDGTWHLQPGHVTAQGLVFDIAEATWNDFPEIFVQATYKPAAGTWDARFRGVTTMDLVQFADWNGDGRMDVVDVMGEGADHWRVWIQGETVNGVVQWRKFDVPVSNIQAYLKAQGIPSTNDI